jgi:hypothetical protein
MPLKRTPWICPNCNELKPTRHESVIRHIVRKHNSLGEPISVTTRQTRYQMIASGSLAPTKWSLGGNSSQGFNNYSFDASIANHKIEHEKPHEKPQTGSSDASDNYLRARQLELAMETNENVEKTLDQISLLNTILANFMHELKLSQKNLGGDFV